MKYSVGTEEGGIGRDRTGVLFSETTSTTESMREVSDHVCIA